MVLDAERKHLRCAGCELLREYVLPSSPLSKICKQNNIELNRITTQQQLAGSTSCSEASIDHCHEYFLYHFTSSSLLPALLSFRFYLSSELTSTILVTVTTPTSYSCSPLISTFLNLSQRLLPSLPPSAQW